MLSKAVEKEMLALLRTHRGVEGPAAWSLLRGWLIAGQECPHPASPAGIRKWMTDQYAKQFMKTLKSLPKRIVPRGVMAALSDYKPKRGHRSKEKAMSTSEQSVIENMQSTSAKKSAAKKPAPVKTKPVKAPPKSNPAPKTTAKAKTAAPKPAAKKGKSGKTAAPKKAKEVKLSAADVPKKEGTVSIGTETPRKGSKIEKIVAIVTEQRGKTMKYSELITEAHKRKVMPRPRGVIRQTDRAISNRILAFKAAK